MGSTTTTTTPSCPRCGLDGPGGPGTWLIEGGQDAPGGAWVACRDCGYQPEPLCCHGCGVSVEATEPRGGLWCRSDQYPGFDYCSPWCMATAQGVVEDFGECERSALALPCYLSDLPPCQLPRHAAGPVLKVHWRPPHGEVLELFVWRERRGVWRCQWGHGSMGYGCAERLADALCLSVDGTTLAEGCDGWLYDELAAHVATVHGAGWSR